MSLIKNTLGTNKTIEVGIHPENPALECVHFTLFKKSPVEHHNDASYAKLSIILRRKRITVLALLTYYQYYATSA
jgi:hypothetical protein